MNCIQCGHQQESGKFCGKCGSPLKVSEKSTAGEVNEGMSSGENIGAAAQAATAQSNEQVERLKATSQMYWSYMKEFGLQPKKIFMNPESELKNALITLVLFIVLTPIAIALFIKGIYKSTIGGLQDELFGGFGPSAPDISISPIFFDLIIPVLLLIGLSLGGSFIIMKISNQPMNFKKLLSIYGTLLIPVVGLVVLGILFIFINQLGLGAGLIALSVILALYLYPSLIIFNHAGGRPKIDSVHQALIYFAGYTIVLYLTVTQYIKSLIAPFIDMFSDFPFL